VTADGRSRFSLATETQTNRGGPKPVVISVAMRARLLDLLRRARHAPTTPSAGRSWSSPTSRGSSRTAPPVARSAWLPVAARHAHSTSTAMSMFDTFKSALFGAGASFAIPDSFSLDDLASLSRKVQAENPSGRASGAPAGTAAAFDPDPDPLATLGLSPDQIDAIVGALTEEEKKRPGALRPPEHRRIARRANERNAEKNVAVTAADVASAVQRAAMLRVVMRRVKKALADGARAPTTWKEFAEIVERSQKNATREELRADAKSLDGAFPATRRCPCGSGRKYKNCCSPFRNAFTAAK